MHKLRILILYPDPSGLALLTSMLKSLGYLIEEATNDRMAVRLMERDRIDLVLAGVDPGDGDALELLTYVRRKHREVPVVLLFPRLHPERAKEALRLGAMAVLKYPVPASELRAAVLQALERCEARGGETSATAGAGSTSGGPGLSATGASPSPASVAIPAVGPHPGPTSGKGTAVMPLMMAGGAPAVSSYAGGGARATVGGPGGDPDGRGRGGPLRRGPRRPRPGDRAGGDPTPGPAGAGPGAHRQ